MDDKAHSADYFEEASFAYFDMQGTVTVTVSCPEVIQPARVLPSCWKMTPAIQGKPLQTDHGLSGPLRSAIQSGRGCLRWSRLSARWILVTSGS